MDRFQNGTYFGELRPNQRHLKFRWPALDPMFKYWPGKEAYGLWGDNFKNKTPNHPGKVRDKF
jgi:hypothetical protein